MQKLMLLISHKYW